MLKHKGNIFDLTSGMCVTFVSPGNIFIFQYDELSIQLTRLE